MAMQYINYLRAKTHLTTAEKSEQPVLSEEDEQFLNRITSQGDALPVPKDAQLALMDGAQNVQLPDSPREEIADPAGGESTADKPSSRRKRTTWSWMRRDSRDAKRKVGLDSKHH